MKEWIVSGYAMDPDRDGAFPYKTLIFDNCTSIYFEKTLPSITTGIPTWPDYNKATADFLSFTRDFRVISEKIGINVIFTAWMENSDHEFNGKKWQSHRMKFTPSLQEQLPGTLEMVGWLQVLEDGLTRVLHLEPSNYLDSKFTREPGSVAMTIPLQITNPDLPSIMRVLKGGEEWDPRGHEAVKA